MNADAPRLEETPDPAFAAHLEWELRRALRREARFAQPLAQPLAQPRRNRTSALALAAVLAFALGGGGAWAAQSALRSRGAQALAAQQRVRVELAELNERWTRTELERVRAEHAGGLAPSTRLLELRAELARAVERLELERLDREEVESTARPPQRGLAAPLGPRDLTRARLECERTSLVEQLAVARERAEQVRALVAAGRAPQSAGDEAQLDLELLSRREALVRERLALRAEFVGGRIDAVRIELLDHQARARTRAALAQLELAAARVHRERLALLAQNGAASARELAAAELAFGRCGAQLEGAQLELEWLAEQLERQR